MFDLTAIKAWYKTASGQLVAAVIEKHMAKISACIFGYVAVEVGHALSPESLLKNCTIRKKIVLDRSDNADVIASPTAFPIATDSIDLIVMTHALDFTSQPHEILREMERSLVAEGHLIIIGFNPFSFYGLWRVFLARTKTTPWCANFYSIKRLRDWCGLLGLEEVEIHYAGHLPPFKHLQAWKKMRPVENFLKKYFYRFGGLYILVVRKRVARLTPLMDAWSSPKRLFPKEVPGSSASYTAGQKNND